jgi:hypothetical protein
MESLKSGIPGFGKKITQRKDYGSNADIENRYHELYEQKISPFEQVEVVFNRF